MNIVYGPLLTRMRTAVPLSVWQRLLRHPFNVQLAAGTLPHAVFLRFVVSDKLYLQGLSRALQMAALGINPIEHQTVVAGLASKIVRSERDLLEKYVPSTTHALGLFALPSPNPVVQQYVQHLHQCAQHDPAVAIASVLPCFVLYRELGALMSPVVQADNPYRAWIASYASPSFLQHTASLTQVAEEMALLQPNQQQQMIAAFVTSTECERAFLDSVYPSAGTFADKFCDSTSSNTL